MCCVRVNLTSEEWIKIRDAAGKQCPKECLRCAEIVRAIHNVRHSIVEERFAG